MSRDFQTSGPTRSRGNALQAAVFVVFVLYWLWTLWRALENLIGQAAEIAGQGASAERLGSLASGSLGFAAMTSALAIGAYCQWFSKGREPWTEANVFRRLALPIGLMAGAMIASWIPFDPALGWFLAGSAMIVAIYWISLRILGLAGAAKLT